MISSGDSLARYWLVVPAAGAGRRFGSPVPKQYLPLAGRSLISRTLERLHNLPGVRGGMIALAAEDPWWSQLDFPHKSWWRTVTGGVERSDSVVAALDALDGLAAEEDWVLVHDVARPCVMPSDIIGLMHTLREHPVGGILAAPLTDTIKQSVDRSDSPNGSCGPEVERTLDRGKLWSAQTPQMFRYGLLRRALQAAAESGEVVTDEAAAIEALGFRPRLVAARRDNIKVTGPEDMAMAAAILEIQGRTGGPGDQASSEGATAV